MIYFDNAATTCVFPEVVEAMQDAMQVTYGNPSAKHMKGIEAENKVKAAQELIAKTLRAKPKEILFTSGGTESNNTAIIGTAMANRRKGKHIITTKVEHASVYEPMYHLEEEGYEVTYLDVDSEGIVDLDQLEESIREDTILVSCMMVNNEIGAIEPIEEIAKIIKAKNPNTIFHVDAYSQEISSMHSAVLVQIRIRFSMLMRFRHMENFRSFQRIWELTYYPQVVIRSMDQKESDFYISRKERKSLRSFSEADSRKECVLERKMYQES